MRRFLFATLLALACSATSEAKVPRYLGETYTCRFPKHGLVVIDTRFPGSSITYRGRKYPAISGSYFYVNSDNPDIIVYFGPNKRFWEFDAYGDRATSCIRRKNRR